MKKNNLGKFILMFCITILFVCGVAFAENSTDWDSSSITAEGFGAAPANARNPGQARALARRAAIVDAYRNLGEFTSGVRVDSETLVQDMIVESDVIKTKMSALIKGAVVISEAANPEGSYQVTMKIPLYGADNSLASVVFPEKSVAEPFPKPILPVESTGSTPTVEAKKVPALPTPTGAYTGLVVDCSGLELNCVMSPVILDESNRPIYGHKNLDYEKVIQNGMVSYSKDGISNLNRAGTNPLVIKAIRLEGHNANPVISQQDANHVLAENTSSDFLSRCAVVFIR